MESNQAKQLVRSAVIYDGPKGRGSSVMVAFVRNQTAFLDLQTTKSALSKPGNN